MVKVVSFDVEGTLVTPRFSEAIWDEGIPALYAKHKGMNFKAAKAEVWQQYQQIGDRRVEWYDIRYWFKRFGLTDYQGLLNSLRHEVGYYPEVREVVSSVARTHKLVVASGSAREFLDIFLEPIVNHFDSLFSSVSDFREVKSPSFYLKVCRHLEIEPQEMAHVGDSWWFDFEIPSQVGVKAFYLDRKGERQGKEVVRDLKEFQRKLSTR